MQSGAGREQMGNDVRGDADQPVTMTKILKTYSIRLTSR